MKIRIRAVANLHRLDEDWRYSVGKITSFMMADIVDLKQHFRECLLTDVAIYGYDVLIPNGRMF